MNSAATKTLLATCALVAGVLLVEVSAWFGLVGVFGFVLAVLFCMDWAAELAALDNPTAVQRFARVLLLTPQILFAVLALSIGLVCIAWILSNTFGERQPEFTGGDWFTLGIFPTMIAVGVGWLITAFRRRAKSNRQAPLDRSEESQL